MSRAWPVERLDPDAPVAVNARRILAVRIAEVYSWEPIVDDEEHVELLHELRISAKRLRYTLELFRSVFGEAGERNIVRFRLIQDVLGSLHDHDVRLALIKDELQALAVEQSRSFSEAMALAEPAVLEAVAASAFQPPPDDPRRGLVHLLSRQLASRTATHREFRALWRALRDEGMRADLVMLSAIPVPTAPETS